MDNLKALTQATSFLPEKIRYSVLAMDKEFLNQIKEIRIKKNCPVLVIGSKEKFFLKCDGKFTDNFSDFGICIAKGFEVDEAVNRLCNFSLHAYQNELKKGYVTLSGGHRVGVCATAVVDADGDIITVKDISSLNIRIAREVAGAADEIIDLAFDQGIKSTLIVGEVSSGKTTVLRDLALRLSGKEFDFLQVCIVDERKELAFENQKLCSMCDVLSGYPRAQGMMIALKAMSPDVIVCDEIGEQGDVLAIEKIANSGTRILATIHADSFSQLIKRPQFTRLMSTCAFETAVILCGKNNPGSVEDIVSLKKYWR